MNLFSHLDTLKTAPSSKVFTISAPTEAQVVAKAQITLPANTQIRILAVGDVQLSALADLGDRIEYVVISIDQIQNIEEPA
jgi:hypothetical protein